MTSNRKTLILAKQDVEKLIDMPHALQIAEEAFKAQGKGKTQMPAKIYLHLDKYNGDFRAMPAYIEGMDACGIKWVNVHPQNKRYGLPTVMATIILSDPKTGFPLAIMDGTHITNVRTGAAGGIAAKYLARKNSKVVSFVGCGVQAQTQLMALYEVFAIDTVLVYDSRRAHALIFKRKMRHLGLKIRICSNIEGCVKESDIIVTATPARKPIIKSEWVPSGAHINAIGADAKGKEELEPSLLTRAKVVVDDLTQAAHSGEINVPFAQKKLGLKDVYGSLGEIVVGKKKGRTSEKEITIFDSTGLAILDVAVAHYVYAKAARRFGRKKLHIRLN